MEWKSWIKLQYLNTQLYHPQTNNPVFFLARKKNLCLRTLTSRRFTWRLYKIWGLIRSIDLNHWSFELYFSLNRQHLNLKFWVCLCGFYCLVCTCISQLNTTFFVCFQAVVRVCFFFLIMYSLAEKAILKS